MEVMEGCFDALVKAGELRVLCDLWTLGGQFGWRIDVEHPGGTSFFYGAGPGAASAYCCDVGFLIPLGKDCLSGPLAAIKNEVGNPESIEGCAHGKL